MITMVLIRVMNDGLVNIGTYTYGPQLWTRRKLRKGRGCCRCGKPMTKGDLAFGPLTNVNNRIDRLCLRCLERLKQENPRHETPRQE